MQCEYSRGFHNSRFRCALSKARWGDAERDAIFAIDRHDGNALALARREFGRLVDVDDAQRMRVLALQRFQQRGDAVA